MINIFFIAVILTIGIDYLHFDETITSAIKRIMTKGKMSEPFELKPFTCSTCSTFWFGLVYLIITHKITLLNVCLTLLMAISTPVINDILILVMNLITKLIKLIDGTIDESTI